MITESFDINSEAIITPSSFFGEKNNICDIAIATFSHEIYLSALALFANEQIGELRAANRTKPIHLLDVNGQKICFYLSEIGATLAGTDIIEINWKTGASKFIYYGSAGSLDKEKTTGKYVIPTEAYRDEGMSYHYAKPSDYIKIKNADIMEKMFCELKLPYIKSRVWTTDAMSRETRTLVQKRKEEGCVAVEMELAGVQAVCDFYGLELYDFLEAGDVLESSGYEIEGLHSANHDLGKLYVALNTAVLL